MKSCLTPILHNVGKYLNNDHDPEPDIKDEEEPGDEYDDYPTNIGENSSAAAIKTVGQTKRDAIAALIMLSSRNGAN